MDGTGIARKEMGVPIANTTMIGALIEMTGVMGLDDMKERWSIVLAGLPRKISTQ